MSEVVAIGELLIDFVAKGKNKIGYPIMEANPGGAPANFLSALASFGITTSLIGKVGDDSFGHMLKKTLVQAGIDISSLIMDKNVFTTLAFVTLSENGDREFSFSRKPGADTKLSFDEIDLDVIDRAKVFHFGTLSLTSEPSKTATIKALEYAKNKGKIISFDPNLRKNLWDNLDDAKKAILYGLKNSDIIKISDDEVEFLFNLNKEDGIKYIFNEFKPKIIYLTCGELGSYSMNKDGLIFTPSLKGIEVVDTTGAGDIFGGSAMYKLLDKNKSLDDITLDDLKDIAKFSSIAAGLSTTKHGGISSVPTLNEVNKIYNN